MGRALVVETHAGVGVGRFVGGAVNSVVAGRRVVRSRIDWTGSKELVVELRGGQRLYLTVERNETPRTIGRDGSIGLVAD
jgi:hypothetical protein